MSGPHDLSYEAHAAYLQAVHECATDNDAAASVIENYVYVLMAAIERHGGRRCDIPACNCNGYHWRPWGNVAAEQWRVSVEKLKEATAAEHVRTLVEARDYLAILCGMRHWKQVSEREAKALSQAAQVIVNEFAEHFSVALDGPA